MTFSLRSVVFAAAMTLTSAPFSSAAPRDESKRLNKRGDTITIIDGSWSAPCGTNTCCTPFCKANFEMDSGDCPDGATKEWAGNCMDVFDEKTQAGDRQSFTTGGCDGWSVFWGGGAVDGGKFITVENDETGKYYQYFVESCKDTEFHWDPYQCASIGGGCDAKISGRGTNPDKAGGK